MMRRKQLYIDDDLDRGLKRLSAETGRSEAAIVREALRTHLEQRLDLSSDPLGDLVGLVTRKDGPTDVAEQHDKYLYEVAEERARFDA